MIEEAAQEFIREYQGTCKMDYLFEFAGTENFVESLSHREETEFWRLVENEIFLCETCNWWCERSEETMDEENFGSCSDCCPYED